MVIRCLRKKNRPSYCKVLMFVLVVLLILFGLFFAGYYFNEVGDFFGLKQADQISLKLEECLSSPEISESCEFLFSDPLIFKKCLGLGELEDICFYTFAVRHQDAALCGAIQDYELRNKCESEIFVVGDLS